jgi:hypothetical protein
VNWLASARLMLNHLLTYHDMVNKVFPRSSSLPTNHNIHRVMDEVP